MGLGAGASGDGDAGPSDRGGGGEGERGVLSSLGGGKVGGMGCDGQETLALAFERPSRQLVLPYGTTANGDGRAHSCAPLL